ncbi:Aldehyde/histidinol dehydrogenase [Thamnidium elegans]|nr:Aldehyde/histidinol dehydrogenase [Thamnidium elegans]
MSLIYNTSESIEDYVTCLRGTFVTGKSRDAYARKFFLERLYSLVKDNEEKFYVALAKDLNKSRADALASEISPVLEECVYFLKHYDSLTKDKKVKTRMTVNRTDTAFVRREALGVVLIISTWNFPLQLSLVPLAGALAAGNCVVLKLSEISVHTSALISELLPKYIDASMYRVVNGGVEETQHLLRQKFDHIFYTGNSVVAKSVMAAAAQHLTPVTLELGGKSPAIVTDDSDMQIVANRIAYGKFFNAGQTCIAVDYVFVPKSRVDEFSKAILKTLQKWYGSDPQKSKDYGRIVSQKHFDRLMSLINHRQSGEVIVGGQSNREDRYIAPTIIANVDFHDVKLMGEEIFGPILPIITYNDIEEPMGLIAKHEPGLALYLFSKKKSVINQVLAFTKSGGVTINDTLLHQAEHGLPFGGVGSSGMGGYHGEKSLQIFSHERAVLAKKQRMEWLVQARYPPSSPTKLALLRAVLLTDPVRFTYIVFKRPIKWAAFIIILLGVLLKKSLN